MCVDVSVFICIYTYYIYTYILYTYMFTYIYMGIYKSATNICIYTHIHICTYILVADLYCEV